MNLVLGVEELQKSYEKAREQLLLIADPVERDIGLGTLRLEARHTLEQLQQSNLGASASELKSFTAYVRSLVGGEITESAVKAFDKAAAKVKRDVWKSLLNMTATGSVSLIYGFIVAYLGAASDAGMSVAGGVVAGTISAGILVKAVQVAGPAGGRAFVDSWDWAAGLGAVSGRAMVPVREAQQRLLGAAATASAYQPLAAKAQARAHVLIALAWAGVGIGLLAFGYGFYEGFQNATTPITEYEFEP